MDPCLIGRLRAQFPDLLSFPYGGLEVFRGLKSVHAGRYPIIYELFGLLDDHRRRTDESVQLTKIFEEAGVLRFSAIVPEMKSIEVKLLELLTESWSEELCEVCGRLAFIDTMSEQQRCRCITHHTCTIEKLERDEQVFTKSMMGYQRSGMPVTLFRHVAEIEPETNPDLLHLTVFALPDEFRPIRGKSLLSQCTPVHFPDLSKDDFTSLFASFRNEEISPVVLHGHGYIV